MDRPYDPDEQASRQHRGEPQDFHVYDEPSGGGPSTMDRCMRNEDVQELNARGQWVPSIPQPYFLLIGVRCFCGARFLTKQRYEEHYALHHILRPASV